jgi:AMP-binding enzyme
MNMLLNAGPGLKRSLDRRIEMMTAGAAPPAAVIEGMEGLGFRITHVYGLTESYGPAVVCAWHDEWDELPAAERARLKARQGVTYPVLEGLTVADPTSLARVPADGATRGEIFMRGNIIMKGYLKNPGATEEAFAGGWFHSGDLGVRHPDGYIEPRTAQRTSSSRAARTSRRSRSRMSSTGTPPCSKRRRWPVPMRCGADTLRLCDPEARSRGLGGRNHRLLPRPSRAFQGAAHRALWPAAENLDRQDPEIHAARARQTRLTRFAKKGAKPPEKCLPQEAPPSIIASNGPFSNPTPAVQPDRRERLFMPQFNHCRRPTIPLTRVASRHPVVGNSRSADAARIRPISIILLVSHLVAGPTA